MLVGSIFSVLILFVAILVIIAETTALSKEYDCFNGCGFGFSVNRDLIKGEIEVQTVCVCFVATYIWKL